MRLWHVIFGVLIFGLLLTAMREPAGRVGVIVFGTMLGTVVIGVTSLLALFQTVGAIGEAKGLYDHAEAVVATSAVLVVGSALISGLFLGGAWLVQAVVP